MKQRQLSKMGACLACGSREYEHLPSPHAHRSMISDGRILNRPLEKIRCSHCGLIRFPEPLGAADVAAIYTSDYQLPTVVGAGEDQRGMAYADLVASVIDRESGVKRVLDVGCGSGAMLRALAAKRADIRAVGVDPARTEKHTAIGHNIDLYSGNADSALDDKAIFDVVVSINTIEHTADPTGFIKELKARVFPGRPIIIICPASQPANCELLFYDHLWTFTPEAFQLIATQTGMDIRSHHILQAPLAGFQMFVLDDRGSSPSRLGGIGLGGGGLRGIGESSSAVAYLKAWQSLDRYFNTALDDRDDPVQMFGAGQMAALFRAYAPAAFARVRRLVLDRPNEAWPLGPIEAYDPKQNAEGWQTLVAVHPSAKQLVVDRIRDDGGVAISAPDTIRA